MSYNSTVTNIGYTPYYLVFGREMTYPVDLIISTVHSEESQSKYVSNLKHRLHQTYSFLREKHALIQRRQNQNYDLNKNLHVYQVGDYVMLTNETCHFPQPKCLGPFRISKVLSTKVYE